MPTCWQSTHQTLTCRSLKIYVDIIIWCHVVDRLHHILATYCPGTNMSVIWTLFLHEKIWHTQLRSSMVVDTCSGWWWQKWTKACDERQQWWQTMTMAIGVAKSAMVDGDGGRWSGWVTLQWRRHNCNRRWWQWCDGQWDGRRCNAWLIHEASWLWWMAMVTDNEVANLELECSSLWERTQPPTTTT